MAEELGATGRYVILAAAFLGWMFSGFQLAVMTLSARSATTEFLRSGQVTAEVPLNVARLLQAPRWPERPPSPLAEEAAALARIVPRWFSWYNAALLFGAASGGLV